MTPDQIFVFVWLGATALAFLSINGYYSLAKRRRDKRQAAAELDAEAARFAALTLYEITREAEQRAIAEHESENTK